MNKAIEFLKKANIFYLATVEDNKPRVRPFGAVTEFNGKVYFCTNNTKDCFKQMLANPNVEISTTIATEWIRISGEVVVDHTYEAKQAVLEDNPSLKNMYSVNDEIFEVFYLTNASATISSFSASPEHFNI